MKKIKELKYASFKTRLFAGFIDILILWLVILLIVSVLPYFGTNINLDVFKKDVEITETIKKEDVKSKNIEEKKRVKKLINTIGWVVSMVYSVSFVSSKKQGTPGKQLFKIMIIDKKKGKMTPYGATLRFIAKSLSNMIFFLGYVPIFFTKERIALHDFLCNTRVVYINLNK